MSNFWNLQAEAGWQLHSGPGCYFSLPVFFLWTTFSPRVPPPVHMRQLRRPCPRILDSGQRLSAEDTVITHAQCQTQCRPFENSICDRPPGGNPTCSGWWGKPALSLQLSHPGSSINFSSCREQCFYKHYWGYYVRGSLLSYTDHQLPLSPH